MKVNARIGKLNKLFIKIILLIIISLSYYSIIILQNNNIAGKLLFLNYLNK